MTMAKTKSIHWRLVLDLSMIPPLGAVTLKVSGWGAHRSFPWPRAAERLQVAARCRRRAAGRRSRSACYKRRLTSDQLRFGLGHALQSHWAQRCTCKGQGRAASDCADKSRKPPRKGASSKERPPKAGGLPNLAVACV